MPTVAELSAQVAELREAIAVLTERLDGVRVIKQRRPQPEGQPCNLGHDPESCPKASVYHYQKGCKGQDCLDKNAAYYAKNRDDKKAQQVVAPPKRRRKVSSEAFDPKTQDAINDIKAGRLNGTKPAPTKRAAKK